VEYPAHRGEQRPDVPEVTLSADLVGSRHFRLLARLCGLCGFAHWLISFSAASICPGLRPPALADRRTPALSMKKWAGMPLTRYAEAMLVFGSATCG